MLIRPEQPAMEPGQAPAGAPQEAGGAPMTSEVMMGMGGPSMPAEMQGQGGIGL
jgi:hypothetical protein